MGSIGVKFWEEKYVWICSTWDIIFVDEMSNDLGCRIGNDIFHDHIPAAVQASWIMARTEFNNSLHPSTQRVELISSQEVLASIH